MHHATPQPVPENGPMSVPPVVEMHWAILAFVRYPNLEHLFVAQQQQYWTSSLPLLHRVHCVLALFNLVIISYVASGFQFACLTAWIILPYMTITLVQGWVVSQPALLFRHHTLFACAFEAAYVIVFAVSAPTWFLVPVKGIGSYAKDFILGSGVFCWMWQSFCSRKLWRHYLWMIPLEQVLLAVLLPGPTCRALDASAVGLSISKQLHSALHIVGYAWVPTRGIYTCQNMVLCWQAVVGLVLLYTMYRLELRERCTFLAEHGMVPSHVWPTMSIMVEIGNVAVLCLHAFSALWVLLQYWTAFTPASRSV